MASVKFIASQARTIFQYKTTRIKVLKCCANVYYNKQCLNKKIVPRYADIKPLNTSPAARNTQKKVHNMRIRDEIRFLYEKRQQLNNALYKIHLEAVQDWGNAWYIILDYIIDLSTMKLKENTELSTII